MTIKDLCKEAHKTACSKGWHDTKVPIPVYIANIHGEVSEAFEEFRSGCDTRMIEPDEGENGGLKPVGFPIEIADAVIRIADMAAAEGIDLEQAIRVKMEYNKTRTYRHGGKLV